MRKQARETWASQGYHHGVAVYQDSVEISDARLRSSYLPVKVAERGQT